MIINKKRNHWAWATPAATLILGFALGATVWGDSTTAHAPAGPEVVTETITEEVEVVTVPEACIAALDDGDVMVDILMETVEMLITLFEEIPDAMLAAHYGDAEGIDHMSEVIEDITADIERLTPIVDENNYHDHASECRAAR